MRKGSLTPLQYRVLVCRGKGMSQRETAEELGTTRANVSMIEHRARQKISRARETLGAYESTLTDHRIEVAQGMRIYEVPTVVLREGDRYGIHLEANFIDIIRMVRNHRPSCLQKGKTTRPIRFSFNQRGKIELLRD